MCCRMEEGRSVGPKTRAGVTRSRFLARPGRSERPLPASRWRSAWMNDVPSTSLDDGREERLVILILPCRRLWPDFRRWRGHLWSLPRPDRLSLVSVSLLRPCCPMPPTSSSGALSAIAFKKRLTVPGYRSLAKSGLHGSAAKSTCDRVHPRENREILHKAVAGVFYAPGTHVLPRRPDCIAPRGRVRDAPFSIWPPYLAPASQPPAGASHASRPCQGSKRIHRMSARIFCRRLPSLVHQRHPPERGSRRLAIPPTAEQGVA